MKATVCLWLMACGASQVGSPPAMTAPQSELERWASERGAIAVEENEEFLAPGGSFVREFELGEGCHLFFVVVAPGIRDADLVLWSPEGQQLVADEAPDARPVVQMCGTQRIFARVSAPAGAGTATLHHFRSETTMELSTLGEGASTYEAHALGELDQALASRGFRVTREWTFEANTDEAVELGLGEERGCYTLVADHAEAFVRVFSDAAELVRDLGDPAMLQWCSPRSQRQRASVEADGTVRIRLYRTTEERAGGTPGLWLGDRSNAPH